MISLHICPAETDGPAGRDLVGTPLQVATAAADYLRSCPSGACLQWPVGAGWSELYLNPFLSLADNLRQAWDEIEGIGCPPAIMSKDEEDMARAIVNPLLRAAAEIEGNK